MNAKHDGLVVLFSSSGRRTSLLKAFKRLEEVSTIITVDPDPLAPTHWLSDVQITDVPKVAEGERFIGRIKEIVREFGVNLLIPTIDPELLVYAKHRDELLHEGCYVMVSDYTFCEITYSKYETYRFFSERGVSVVPTFKDPSEASLSFPLFVKPDRGSASKNTYVVNDEEELKAALKWVPDYVIQPYIPHPEITIDGFLGERGEPVFYVPRVRLKVLGGESIQGITVGGDELESWVVSLLRVMGEAGALGPVTIQAFWTPDGPLLSEINPRFGGGFPLGLAAGAEYPAWCVRLARGERVPPRLGEYRRGLVMTRAFEEFYGVADVSSVPELSERITLTRREGGAEHG